MYLAIPVQVQSLFYHTCQEGQVLDYIRSHIDIVHMHFQ